MRLIPMIIAVIVTAFMYLFIIERDKLLAFAGTEMAEEESASESDATEPVGDLVRVIATHSEAREIDSAVVVRGETEANREVNVMAETTGLVVSDPLRKGAFVEEGQVLCMIDPGTRDASLAEAVAALASAKAAAPAADALVEQARAQLDEARINDNAASKLSKDGFASETRVASTQAAVRTAEAAVSSALSGLESAQANIQSAEARVASAQKEIDRLTVKAPFAGLLETDTAEIGSLLAGGAGLCATVIQLDPVKLIGFVPETEVNRIKIGALAGAQLADGSQVTGNVTFISRSADATTRTFRVEITVPNEDLRIRDGQTAEIIIASDGTLAHLLPQSVLTLNADGVLGVRVVEDESIVDFIPVTVLRDTAEGVWLGGLPESVNVIVIGQEYVISGVEVEASYQEHNE